MSALQKLPSDSDLAASMEAVADAFAAWREAGEIADDEARELALAEAERVMVTVFAEKLAQVAGLVAMLNRANETVFGLMYEQEKGRDELRAEVERERGRIWQGVVNRLMQRTGCTRDAAEITANMLMTMGSDHDYIDHVDAFLDEFVQATG
jgi:phosphopantothenoylcysteine synthetase/decarboxylase